MHYRVMRYMTRPIIYAIDAERRSAGIPDRHQHPAWNRIPGDVRLPILFAHPESRTQTMRCLVLWPTRELAWWMDVPFTRWRRLPKMEVDNDAYRL